MATQTRAYRVRPPKVIDHTSGPWYGVRDDIQPVAADDKFLQNLRNMWIRDLPHIPYADSRPGMSQIGTQMGDTETTEAGDSSIAAIVTDGIGYGQLITQGYSGVAGLFTVEALGGFGQRWFQFTKLNGTTYTVGFCGGHVYTLDWSATAAPSLTAPTNLITNPSALDASPWAGAATVTANTTTAPDGTVSADTLTESSASSDRRQTVTFTTDGTKFVGLYIKQGTSPTNRILVRDETANVTRQLIEINWAGSVPTASSIDGSHLVEGPDAFGFYALTFTVSGVLAASTNVIYIQPSFANNGTSLIVWNVDVHDLAAAPVGSTASGTTTEILTTAELLSAGVVVDPLSRVYCTIVADTLFVHDGVHQPWTWDGTAHGGVTLMTNCPVLYGPVVVHYAKVVGIKNAEPNTIVWSEEAQPNLGYEAGGYNNAWTLGQTDQERFYGLAATDAALYVFRARSITYVLGAITTDFSTTGTREAVSSVIGSVSPASIYTHDAGVYFAGSDLRLYKITKGHAIQEIATGIRVTLSSAIPHTKLPNVVVSPWTDGDAIMFGFPGEGSDDPSLFPVVSVWNDECIGVWDGWRCTTLDEVVNGQGHPVVVHFGGEDHDTSRSGYAYVRSGIDGPLWGDHYATEDTAVERLARPAYMGYTPTLDQQFDILDVSLLVSTSLSALGYAYSTSRSERAVASHPRISPHVPASTNGLQIARFDLNLFDASVFAGELGREQHQPIGLQASGRWFQPTLTHATTEGERFTLQTVAVRAFPLDRRARIL